MVSKLSKLTQHFLLKLFNAVSKSTFAINYSVAIATAFDLTITAATLTYKVVKNGINAPFTIYETIKKAIVLK